MNRMSLDKRMVLCEEQVLEGIVEPLATGDMELLAEDDASSDNHDAARRGSDTR
jgi:hypothetical protein